MRKTSIFMLVIMIMVYVTGCRTPASMESNFNKYFVGVLDAQNESKKASELPVDDFYDYNNINPDNIYNMPDDNYLVFYHKGGNTCVEQGFKNIVEKYRKSGNSFEVYLVDINKYRLMNSIQLVFISRNKDDYRLVDKWLVPKDVKGLPYRKNNIREDSVDRV